MEKTARFTYYIQASQGNAQGELSLSQLVKWMLDAATSHAESWGVGYSTLIQENRVWVLARLGVEMDRFPVIGDTLVIETWVEGYNPHFSARNFRFTDLSGSVLGYARTIWSVIDVETRHSVDLGEFCDMNRFVADKACPMSPLSKIRDFSEGEVIVRPVRYSDIDLNRHVNSVKYIEYMQDVFPLQTYDTDRIARFEINYLNEARYGMNLKLFNAKKLQNEYFLAIKNEENETMCRGKVIFAPRKEKESMFNQQ